MAIRTYKVTLDTKNYISPEPVYLRQGDKTGAVVIDATLMDNGSPVSLSGLTPMFKANTADGQAVIADSTGFNIVNASGGEFTYQVPSQLGSVDGKIKIAYFSFLDSSGAQSTFNVVFVVEKAADMTQESAKDWSSNLNEIIDQYNQWVNNSHSSWQDFVDTNKEIIESIDPGGALLTEVIDARRQLDAPEAYPTLGKRLNDMDKLGLTGMYFPKLTAYQEDICLLNLADKWIIIDTGDDRDWANLKPFILNHTDHIDIGIISHYHEDHVGNAVTLINDTDIKTSGMTWYVPPMPTMSGLDIVTDALTNLQAAAKNDRETVNIVNTDLLITLDKLTTIQFFNSSTASYQHYYDENDTNYNDYSMVALIKYNSTSLLFAGDIMEDAINWISSHYQPFLHPVDFLKINHHGYDGYYSANFYTKIRPTVAIAMLTKENYLKVVPGSNNGGIASTSINMLNSLGTQVSFAFEDACNYTVAQNSVVPVRNNNSLRGTSNPAKIKYYVRQSDTVPTITDGSEDYPFCSLDEMIAHVQTMPNVCYELHILSGNYSQFHMHSIYDNISIYTEDGTVFDSIYIVNCTDVIFATDVHVISTADESVKIDFSNVNFNAKLVNDDTTADTTRINASRFLSAASSQVYVFELVSNNRSCAAVATASAQISIYRASGNGNLFGMEAKLGSIYVKDLWNLKAHKLRYEESGVISADVPWTDLTLVNGYTDQDKFMYCIKGDRTYIRGSITSNNWTIGDWTTIASLPGVAFEDNFIYHFGAISTNGVTVPVAIENGDIKVHPTAKPALVGINFNFLTF